MSLSKVHSIALAGLTGTVIEVEVDISAQLPAFVLVGLPDASLSESTARVRSACGNSGHSFPSRKVVVNLSPAAVPKSGSGFDLAIAVAVLVAMEKVPQARVERACLVGELGLDGILKAVPGVLPITLAAREAGFERVIVPVGNAAEAALVEGIEVLAVSSLSQLVAHLCHGLELPAIAAVPAALETETRLDLDQVLGQAHAVEGLIVAAAGGHHMIMSGAPGSGKTMLAERLTGILPALSVEQAIEVAAIESICGDGQGQVNINRRPRFQAPHHSASSAAVIGGGSGKARPGAVSLAHHGVLFMDEAPEFRSGTIDGLRQILEDGFVKISRSNQTATFPAQCQLILAANPCPCGYFGINGKECKCSASQVRTYLNRISGPMLDRIDIRLPIQPASASIKAGLGEAYTTTAEAAARVGLARAAASERLGKHGLELNARVPGALLRKRFSVGDRAKRELDRLVSTGWASQRGYDRCLRLAWTIADLEGTTTPTLEQVQRAVSLRGSDSLQG